MASLTNGTDDCSLFRPKTCHDKKMGSGRGSAFLRLIKYRTDVYLLGARLIRKENISAAGGCVFRRIRGLIIQCIKSRVPSIVTDIIESSAAGAPSIESFLFGGAPAHAGLAPLAEKTFPNAILCVTTTKVQDAESSYNILARRAMDRLKQIQLLSLMEVQ